MGIYRDAGNTAEDEMENWKNEWTLRTCFGSGFP